ncbi:MAG: ATP-binding protein [Paludibacteraceae bacterium]|nr:ATP-binding protein [Paludibacteraceae bacterium]
MGVYVNKSSAGFKAARKSEYVDKSRMIAITNQLLDSKQSLMCVSRPRRFGKSMALEMLCAYYCEAYDSSPLFKDLQIASDDSYQEYLNKFPVISLDMTNFLTRGDDNSTIVSRIQSSVIAELNGLYGADYDLTTPLMTVLESIVAKTQQKFIFLIDEWDAICRELEDNDRLMNDYVNLLRSLFKSSSTPEVFSLVYMTGILPIIKYNTQSALNAFHEYSMVTPGKLAPYIGFTNAEVQTLCEKYGMSYAEMKNWYDGYNLKGVGSIYNSNSVITAIDNEKCTGYWTKTAAYDSVSSYISMNFEGLRDDIIIMLGGGRVRVDTSSFCNQMHKVNSKDDIFTALIHLGYLAYDDDGGFARIPNLEVAGEFRNAVRDCKWNVLSSALRASEDLLDATIEGKADMVADTLERIHEESSSILQYNDENSLACALTIAYYTARMYYMVVREMPAGKGFADLVLLPSGNQVGRKPAMVIELKYDQTVDSAISQIKQQNYPQALQGYTGDLLLVGVNYNKADKKHECKIEHMQL